MTPLSAWSWLLVCPGSSAPVHGRPRCGPCARLEGSPNSAFKSWKSIDCLSSHDNFRDILLFLKIEGEVFFFTRNYIPIPVKVSTVHTTLPYFYGLTFMPPVLLLCVVKLLLARRLKQRCILQNHVSFAPPTKFACHAHKHRVCPIDLLFFGFKNRSRRTN